MTSDLVLDASLSLFKVLVAKSGKVELKYAQEGFITDFRPTDEQLAALRRAFKPVPIVSLFSVEERLSESVENLFTKQLLHYLEVYDLNSPGLFNLEVSEGKLVSLAYVKAVSVDELQELVLKLCYANRPLADVSPVIELVKHYGVDYNINSVANNELRVALFNVNRDTFERGDDAVRYVCYGATDDPLLIKSREVIEAVKQRPPSVSFLERHALPLAQVFNRHKRLIMACKNKYTAKIINKISRLSKTAHVPLVESDEKSIVARVVSGQVDLKSARISKLSLRAKLKVLNYIEHKKAGHEYDVFTIRNGKTWFENNRPKLDLAKLEDLSVAILAGLKRDLKHLRTSKILLDPNVEYGLPISRKQALGNLPYGTKVKAVGPKLSAGIYWHNDADEGRSIDLDLSAINEAGDRTGWGAYSGYASSKIVFSGDVTDARNGATEFMTVDSSRENKYGLLVNTFRGPTPCDIEVVVGTPTNKSWQEGTLIKERATLASKGCVIGFLKGNSFVVYSGRLNSNRVSGGKHPVIDKGLGHLWTVTELLDRLEVNYDVVPRARVKYDHDLSYKSFTLDKLEALFKL